MTKGDRGYVVEKCLLDQRKASLLAGEVGLGVTFECRTNFAKIRVLDKNRISREIPATAICTVPEGHLSNLYREPCPACGMQLLIPSQLAPGVETADVMSRYLPWMEVNASSEQTICKEFTVENLILIVQTMFPDPGDEHERHEHPITAIGVVLLAAAIGGTTHSDTLVRFTGYSRDFILAVSINMKHNRIWIDDRYERLDWLLPKGIIDGSRLWEQIDAGCGLFFFPGVNADIAADPCGIYWTDIGKQW